LAEKIQIRKPHGVSEFEEIVRIQKVVWKHDDQDVTPVHQFLIHFRMGAVILGAFVGGRMAGFVYSFPALRDGVFFQHSHLLAVLPEFQGMGIGKKLKRAQRLEVLKQGLDLITWTYDPLQARNANLNLHTLGVHSRTYLPNFYGFTPSLCLGPDIPTDRLFVEWKLRERRSGSAGPRVRSRDLGGIPRALEREAGTGVWFPLPAAPRLDLTDPAVLLEIPPDVNALRPRREVIAAWQKALRRAMTAYFGRGYAATDFLFGERCYYVLTK
jgi:predicted GNAT superfamily acetyltransferase